MSTNKLTKIQKILIYGLKQLKIKAENAELLARILEDENDQIAIIKYLLEKPNTTQLKVVKEIGLLLEKRKKINEESEN